MGLEYITQPQVFLAPITAVNGIQGYEDPLPLVTTYQYWTSTANVNTNTFPIPGFWPMLEEPASFLINIGGVPQTPSNYSIDKIGRRITFISDVSAGIDVSFTQLAAAFLSSFNFAFVESVSGTFDNLFANKAYINDIDTVKSVSVSTTDIFTNNIYFPLSVGGYIHEDTIVFGNVTVYGSLSATGEVVTSEVANLSSQSVVANNPDGKTALKVLQTGTPSEPIMEVKGVLEQDIFRILNKNFPSYATATLDGILSATAVLSPSLSTDILKTSLIHNSDNITLSATDNIIFNTNNNERIRIDKITGNVGINTSTPTAPLEVGGNVHLGNNNQENYIAFRGTTGDNQVLYNNTYIGERLYEGTERSELVLFKGNDILTTSGPDRIRLVAADLVFDTLSAGTPTTFTPLSSLVTQYSTQRMVVKQNGNVGIGVSEPALRLEVGGSQLFQNTNVIQWRDIGGTARSVLFGLWSDNSTYLETQNAINLRTSGSVARFQIASNGNISMTNSLAVAYPIGTTPGHALDVNGNIIARTTATNVDREIRIGNQDTQSYSRLYRYRDNLTNTSRNRFAIWNYVNINNSPDTNRGGYIDYRPFEASYGGGANLGRLYIYAPAVGSNRGGDILFYAGRNLRMVMNGTNGFVGVNGNPVRQFQVFGASSTPSFRNSGHPTTASAANTHITTSGDLFRSTSSILYKTDVEDLNDEKTDIVYKLRPVWYRSTCPNDRTDWSWYGLIAEEVAELEPRLVQWGHHYSDYKTVTKTKEVTDQIPELNPDGTQKTDSEGNVVLKNVVRTETYEDQELKDGVKESPVNVQYDRLTVLLIKAVQDLKTELDTVKKELAELKNK
jgi:hypothetical protein